MSSNRFDAFYEAAAALAGQDTSRALVAYLRERGRGHHISITRVAAELSLDEDTVQELVALACTPAVGLLTSVWRIRCPHCKQPVDLEPLLAADPLDGEAECPECRESITNPAGVTPEERYRLTEDTDAEVAAAQHAERAKPVMRAVMLCALPVELVAIHAQMKAGAPVGEQTIEGGEIYVTGTLVGEHITWELRAACSERGNPAVAASLANAINNFRPDVALFVGVAGGVPGEVALGDVVAATTVFDYDQGKETLTGYEPRELQLHSSFDLRQRALHVAISDAWKTRILTPHAEALATFTAHVEPIAAGGKVIAASTSETARLLAAVAPRAVAVETEGAGFLETVRRFKDVSGIVVRGISDLLDDKKSSDLLGSQPRAAAHAAAFTFELLSLFQPPASQQVGGPAEPAI
jgi:nucleoside phosphorylase